MQKLTLTHTPDPICPFTTSSAMTFYQFSIWTPRQRNFTSGFGIGDTALTC